MSHSVHIKGPASVPRTTQSHAPEAKPADQAPRGRSEKGDSFREVLSKTAKSIAKGERVIDRAIAQARRGRAMEPGELIALQAGVYRYTQEVELASKMVEKTTGAVKQTLQSQQ